MLMPTECSESAQPRVQLFHDAFDGGHLWPFIPASPLLLQGLTLRTGSRTLCALNPEEETVPHHCWPATVFASLTSHLELFTSPHPECPSKDVSVQVSIQVTTGQVTLSLSLSLRASHLTTLRVPGESQNLRVSLHSGSQTGVCARITLVSPAFSEMEERGRGGLEAEQE